MKPFKYSFQVPFQELDPAGILFFARLFDHAHDAWAALMAQTGHSLKSLLEAGNYLIPLAHAEADYLHPLKLDDSICITVTPEAVGNSSLGFSYRFHKGEILCATARTTHVFVDRQTGKPVPVPKKLCRELGIHSS
ncbi:MAG TPA: acyl-CoA thioesterase [Chromatiaceae bacterium]|nr:acyl-CoA thioesterase [Chromatiaceae bacterium]